MHPEGDLGLLPVTPKVPLPDENAHEEAAL